MKFSILGFQQDKLITAKLDTTDALLLRQIKDLYSSSGMDFITHEGVRYMWVNYTHLIKILPIIGSRSSIMKRIKRFSEELLVLRVLKHSKNGKKGNFAYIAPTEKLDNLQDFTLVPNGDNPCADSGQPLCQTETTLVPILDNKDTSLRDTSLRDNNKKLNKKDLALQKFKDHLKEFWCDKLEESLIGFIEIRKSNTDLAVKKVCNKLKELSSGVIEDMLKILDNSIMNNWQGVFELRKGFAGHSIDSSVSTWKYRADIAEACNSTWFELPDMERAYKEQYADKDPRKEEKSFRAFCGWLKAAHSYDFAKTASKAKFGKLLEDVKNINVSMMLKK